MRLTWFFVIFVPLEEEWLCEFIKFCIKVISSFDFFQSFIRNLTKVNVNYEFHFQSDLSTSSPRVEFHFSNGVAKWRGWNASSKSNSEATWNSIRPNHLIFDKLYFAESSMTLKILFSRRKYIRIYKIIRFYSL